MISFPRLMICFAVPFFSSAAIAQNATTRVALVMGNSLSAQVPSNPVRDATVMTEKLTELGFKVFPYYDADQSRMEGAIRRFARTLRSYGGNVEAFVYYAGHGSQQNGGREQAGSMPLLSPVMGASCLAAAMEPCCYTTCRKWTAWQETLSKPTDREK